MLIRVFRDENARCPQCQAALDPAGTRHRCTTCKSTFVPGAEFARLFDELSPDDDRPLAERMFCTDDHGYTCPFCATRMYLARVYTTWFEVCPTHGVWIKLEQFQELLTEHADLYTHRNRDHSKFEAFLVVPVLGPLVAIPLQAVLLPWMKRRRLRRFVRETTPKKP